MALMPNKLWCSRCSSNNMQIWAIYTTLSTWCQVCHRWACLRHLVCLAQWGCQAPWHRWHPISQQCMEVCTHQWIQWADACHSTLQWILDLINLDDQSNKIMKSMVMNTMMKKTMIKLINELRWVKGPRVKDLEVTGNFTLAFPSYVKILSGEYDGTVANFIQFVCTKDTATQSVWCTISQEATYWIIE